MRWLKNILFSLLLISAFAGGYYGYVTLKKSKRPAHSAIENIPAGCVAYIAFSDLAGTNKQFNSQNMVIEQLKGFSGIGSFFDRLDSLVAGLQNDSRLLKEIQGARMHVGIYDENSWLLSFPLSELGEQENIRSLLLSELGHQISGDRFELFDGTILFLRASEGIIMMSNREELLARATDKKTEKLFRDPHFTQFSEQLEGKNFPAVYIDHAKFAAGTYHEKLNLAYLFQNVRSCFNITSSPSHLSFNGLINLDSAGKFTLLKGTGSFRPAEIIRVIPDNTAYLEVFSTESKAAGSALIRPGQDSLSWKNLNDKALFDIRKEFYENLGNHIIRFQTPQGYEFLAAPVADTVLTAEHLSLMQDSVIYHDSIKICRLTGHPGALLRPFNPFFANGIAYATMLSGHIIFSSDDKEMQVLLAYLLSGSVKSNDTAFLKYLADQVPENCNYLLYTSPAVCYRKPNRFFNFKGGSDTAFNNIGHLSLAVADHGKLARCRFQVSYETRGQMNDDLWLTQLDTFVNHQPFRFINHNNNETEIVVQDAANTLYLLNAKGQVLWRKKLPEAMLSELFVVDLFKNNKNQLLFNSRNYLHLIDRNGHYVEGYPVKLPAPATAPLSVFDYENTKDYRLFIPCADQAIYNYSLKGKQQEGFTTVKTSGEVKLPVQYAVIGQSQYLLTCDTEGKIYAFSRKGAIKVTFRNRVVKDCGAFALDLSQNIFTSSIVYFDEKNSLLNKTYFTDKKEVIPISAAGEGTIVRFQNVGEKLHTDLLLVNGHEISAFDLAGQPLLKKTMPVTTDEARVFRNENHTLLFALNREQGQLYMTDLQKEKQTILAANTLPLVVELFGNNKKYMITGTGKTLYCRLLK